MRLEGKVGVVTGAGSGIGRASALAMAREGARVMVADVNDEAGATTVEAIEAGGGAAAFLHTDVTDEAQCGALVAATVAEFGALHVAHANAGIALPFEDGFAPDVSPATWDRVIATNLSGVFYLVHHAVPAIAGCGGGSIITTASSMATLPLGGQDAYAASKGGVALLTRSMAPGAGRLGIRVNAICPGYVETALTGVIWGIDQVREGFEAGHATGLQTPEEIGDVVVFLASDESRSLTGAVLTCDRGWTAFKQPDVLRGG